MGDTLYAYKGNYWKVLHNFQYTGETVPFTLEPGKYLLICHGAQGGLTNLTGVSINYGGASYGVLDLKETKTMYATVGGNGGSAVDNSTPGTGGFNGGGDGGKSYNNAYLTGAGGGGASDIRLLKDDGSTAFITKEFTIPEEYRVVEYIESATGYESINTGVDSNFSITLDVQFTKSGIRQVMGIDGENGRYFGSTTDNKLEYSSYVFPDSNTQERSVFTYTYEGITSSVMWNEQKLNSHTVTTTSDPCLIGPISITGTNYKCYLRIYNAIMRDSHGDMIRYFVPCYRIEDNVPGLYDTINGVFYINTGTGSYNIGDELESNVITYKSTPLNKSLLSRLIVAGGGGGSTDMTTKWYYAGNGGGVVGGYVEKQTVATVNGGAYSGQLSGYRFGEGMSPLQKTRYSTCCAQGASGGGGGWFGGYAAGSVSDTNTSTNGGGGSGYVLTEESYKPEGYLLNEEYYLTDTFMCGGMAIDPQILICVPTSVINIGDTIIFPCIGETEHVNLPLGKYRLKCCGGDGGCRYILNESQRGGYAEGILNNPGPSDIFVNVGGSGIGTMLLNSRYATTNSPTMMFNGGGASGNIGSLSGGAGGGASDIRIGSNSLYSRVIVAGGAGGNGAVGKLGGAGGGETGGTVSGGYGTNSGPGTQTESPQNSSYSTINGGFGYGGNGVNESSGYGGAGGGGWFGGSGTQPDGSGDDDKGGSGGSGYVLTEESYKPEGYLLNEEYYLTDTVLTTGGNTLPIGHTEITIEVLDVCFVWLICHDDEGYKRFDEESQRWVVFSQTITPELIKQYGSYNVTTDEGLLDQYEIVLYDQQNSIESIDLNVVPIEQTITRTVNQNMNAVRTVEDVEYDPDVYSIRSEVICKGFGSDSKMTLNTYINKKDVSDSKLRLYCTQVFSK